ncbi:MAG TPA: alpha-galactosidase [Anaerolineae bacterium]|nr:alpha-galactosidase [Anaerolineae bacterium]
MPGQEVRIGEQLVLQPASGLIKFVRQASVLLDRATAGVRYADARGGQKELALAGHTVSYGLAQDSVSVSIADENVELAWQVSLGEQMSLSLEITNVGRDTIRIHELCVLDVDARQGGSLGLTSPPESWRFFQNGWQSRTPAFSRRTTDGMWVNPNTPDYHTQHQPHALPRSRGILSSEWFTVIVASHDEGASTEPVRLLGFTSAAEHLTELRLDLEGNAFKRLQAISHADGVLLPPAQKLSSETLLFAAGADPLALLDSYANRLGEVMGARVATDKLVGRCSSYCLSGDNTAVDVQQDLTLLQQEHLPVDVVLAGDGYQTSIGDWLDVDTARYPRGMKHVAGQIAAAGYRPGLWIAPFAVSSSSRLYGSHPDWVLRHARGDPVLASQHQGADIYALDLSLSAVQNWLRDLFHTLCEDWDFEFFEVDWIYLAALAAVRSNPRMTRAQAVRQGLKIIRTAIEDKFLLGSGAPLGPSIGIVDGMRVGPDTQADWRPYWPDLSAPSAANASLNSITRGFMHRKLWLNVPGSPRGRPGGAVSKLTTNEMRMLTTVMGLLGGSLFDSFTSLGRSRAKHLRQVWPPYGKSAVPLDLFQHERPRLLALPVTTCWGSWTIVALLNWDDRARVSRIRLSELGLPPMPHHVYNYWRQSYLDVTDDHIVIDRHQPHEAALLLIKPVSDQPQVLTSTFHLIQGAVEIQDVRLSAGSLLVEMNKPGKQFGQLLFAVPHTSEWHVVASSVNGRSRRPREISTGIWQVGFSLSNRATVELLFG